MVAMIKIKIIPIILILFVTSFTSACSSTSIKDSNSISKNASTKFDKPTGTENSNIGAKAAKKDRDLTIDKMLTYAIQDEYLAYGEYEYILSTFGNQKPFSNIIKAEEKHIEMLKVLFEKYKIQLPFDDSKNHLIIPNSIEESLKAGVQAEIENIAMYEDFLIQQLPDDVKSVFNELMNASKSHLDAFEKNLSKGK